jgi:hypothetical protein
MRADLKIAIDVIVDSEMKTIRKMKKKDMISLFRDLLEERCLEMTDDTIIDFYNEVTNEATV